MKSTMHVVLERLCLNITFPTRKCLNLILSKTGEKLGPLIERLLQDHPEIIKAKRELKIGQWQKRRGAGRPKEDS